nr:MAG TPA: hypothetical protein [Caudoviricetes sp.]
MIDGRPLCYLSYYFSNAYSVPICAVVLCAIRLSRAVHSPQSKRD